MSDLIRKQDVLALAKDVTLQNGCKHRCIDATMIYELPSAEPIIYCKDCVRHNVSVGDWYDNHELKVCPLVGHRGSAIGHEFDYQFCAYAERRTDEAD